MKPLHYRRIGLAAEATNYGCASGAREVSDARRRLELAAADFIAAAQKEFVSGVKRDITPHLREVLVRAGVVVEYRAGAKEKK